MGQRLYEMDVCRAFATISIVMTHSFAPYSGCWSISVPDVFPYKCIGLFANVFNLSLFVFISGYVFSFQDSKCPTKGYKDIIRKKFKRLIIPCLFWGLIYMFVFNMALNSPIDLLSYLSGVGHLWFLPMLFWVFVFFCFLRKFEIGESMLLPLCLLSIIVPSIASLGILSGLYYLIWFACGFWSYKHKDKIKDASPIYFFLLFLMLFAMFMGYVLGRSHLNELRSFGLIYKFVFQILEHSILFPIAIAGISFVYLLSKKMQSYIDLSKKEKLVPKTIGILSKYSMGIYIFHDFIIELLYRNTDYLFFAGMYAPWLTFVMAIILSIVCAKVVKLIPILHNTI